MKLQEINDKFVMN